MLVAADRVRDLLPILNCERAVEGVLPCQNPPTPMRATQCVLPSACYPVRATQCVLPSADSRSNNVCMGRVTF